MAVINTERFFDPEPILQFFEWDHLPVGLAAVSQIFQRAALEVCNLPRNPERSVALRKLLEAKDAAVRSVLYEVPGP